MNTTTEFQLVDINKLVPYANNARTHNKEQILKPNRNFAISKVKPIKRLILLVK